MPWLRPPGVREFGLTDALVLTAEMATPENTSRFGFWLGRDAPGPIRRSGFYGDSVELRNPARFVGDETLDITVATVHPRPLQITWLERHALHTQTFIPLGGKPFAPVLASPTGGVTRTGRRIRVVLG